MRRVRVVAAVALAVFGAGLVAAPDASAHAGHYCGTGTHQSGDYREIFVVAQTGVYTGPRRFTYQVQKRTWYGVWRTAEYIWRYC